VSATEILMVGGERIRVEQDATQVEAVIIAAARGSIMQLACITEAQTGQAIALNPEHVMLVRGLSE
jgi:hypothetical protein